MPLVSVITPTFNHAKLIAATIRSVLAQSYADWEMIIVDDGSTDGTPEVCESLCDDRIRLIRQQNKGIRRLSETYNLALRLAKGDLIAVLEGDDLWPVDKLSYQVDLMRRFPAAVVSWGHCGRVHHEMEAPCGIGEATPLQERELSSREALWKLLLGRLTLMPVTAVIRRSALESIGGFQQPHFYPAVEHPTWLGLAGVGGFVRSSRMLGFWRQHIGQTTHRMGLRLSFGVGKMNYQHVRDHRAGLSAAPSLNRMRRLWRQHLARGCFYGGRYRIVQGDFVGAARKFAHAFRLGSVAIRARAAVALCSLKFGVDPERVMAALGGTRYRASR